MTRSRDSAFAQKDQEGYNFDKTLGKSANCKLYPYEKSDIYYLYMEFEQGYIW